MRPRFRVQGLGFRVWIFGSGFRVWALENTFLVLELAVGHHMETNMRHGMDTELI